jgi:hypothetical protein
VVLNDIIDIITENPNEYNYGKIKRMTVKYDYDRKKYE